MKRALGVAGALAVGACRISADYEGTRFLCADGVCPPGFVCGADGFCGDGTPDAAPEPPPPDARAADAATSVPDAAPIDATLPPAACGKPTAFVDDFEDGVRDPFWEWSFEDTGASLDEAGGHMIVNLAISDPGSTYAGYASSYWADLTDSRLFVEIPIMSNTATTAQTFLQAVGPGNSRLFFMQHQGTLYFTRRVSGMETDVAMIPYDPIAHRWWQLREQGGTVHWETSSDGTDWTVQVVDAAPSYLGTVRLEISGGTYTSVADPGAPHFDRFNGGTPTGMRWCKSESRQDDFEDGTPGMLWSLAFGSSCVRSEAGGVAQFTPATTGWNYCGYRSGTLFDLTESRIFIEVPQMLSTTTGAIAFFKVEDTSGQYVQISQQSGMLRFHSSVGGMSITHASEPWDPVAHRWWRLSEEGGTISADVAPDGLSWRPVGSVVAPIPIDAVTTVFGAGISVAAPSSGTVRFDNYNRVP